jgi:DNA helicase-2/ATP-dependent DNA helicase PcrA
MGGRESESSRRAAEILNGLSPVQRQAAMHGEGPIVVFAGAGSGKTRILTHRIAYLIENGVPPWEILAVTFTNKAAGEMRHRLEALTPLGKRCLIATFHSACARWLREFAPELGYSSDFTIYDEADATSALKTILAELNVKLDEQNTVQEYRAAIGRVKTMAMLPSDERLHREYAGIMPPVGVQVYQRYQEYLAACNAMDFGDLIMNVLLLLRRNSRVREVLQKRYRYILVDEYQDTNRTQFELIARLSEVNRNLFVVGDDDQSIYSWRGAVPSNIIDFDKVYPDAKRITMEQNYRCTSTIVNAASAMIQKNKRRVAKQLFTENESGDLIDYRLEADNEIEAWWVSEQVKSEVEKYSYSDVAIFYRTNSQSRLMEDALRRSNIPYQIYGTVRFYDRAEIKDLMAYLRVLVNPNDDVSVKRIFNVPTRGLGQKAEDTVEAEALRRGLPLMKAVSAMVAEGYPKLAVKLKEFVDLFETLRQRLAENPIERVLEILLEATKYTDYVRRKFPEQAEDKLENVHELGAALADFGGAYPEATIAEWLQSVTLTSETSQIKGGVSLMTLHMAKGLEFKRVYILGLEEGLLPHKNSVDNDEGLEEERRLFYVGMTRAKEKLSLIGAYRRRTYTTWAANRPSRFLSDIPSEHLEQMGASQSYGSPYASYSSQYEYSYDESSAEAPFAAGQTVRHPTFGKGVIEEILQEFGVSKVVVRFAEFGRRKVTAHHLEL